MRAKAADAPCSSEQHWRTAIEMLANMVPEYQPTDPEHLYDLKASLLNQNVLHGRLSAEDALNQLHQYEPKEN